MNIVCLDLEGVLVPEIWIAFAEASGIPELKRTTRDEPDYDKLMKWRIGILKEHGLGLKEIQETIAKIDPMPGAREFLDELRSLTQVIIISDTFTQFATPLMKKLGWPTIFCNSLEVAEDGEITGFRMRCEQSKLTTVKALQSIGYETIASGDSHNDLGMIQASKAGFLFRRSRQTIRSFLLMRPMRSCLRQSRLPCKSEQGETSLASLRQRDHEPMYLSRADMWAFSKAQPVRATFQIRQRRQRNLRQRLPPPVRA